jgi:hypothetical protein
MGLLLQIVALLGTVRGEEMAEEEEVPTNYTLMEKERGRCCLLKDASGGLIHHINNIII